MDPSQIMLPSTGPLRYTANPEAEDFDLQDLPTGRGLLGCEDVAFHGKNDDNIKYYVEHIWKVGDGNSEIDCYFLKSSHVCFLHVFFVYAYCFIGDATLVCLFPARFGRNFWLKSWIDGRSAVWCPKKLVCLLGTREKSLAGGIVLWWHDG